MNFSKVLGHNFHVTLGFYHPGSGYMVIYLYILIFRSLFPILILSLEVLSGQHIPRPKGVDEGDIIDPYVEVYSHYQMYVWC